MPDNESSRELEIINTRTEELLAKKVRRDRHYQQLSKDFKHAT